MIPFLSRPKSFNLKEEASSKKSQLMIFGYNYESIRKVYFAIQIVPV